jgi:F-type H+-transporting ATPase subunit alpha
VAADLRVSYSQFEELEAFARFGTQLDEETRKTLERGRRTREVLKQPQYEPMSASEQIAVLVSLTQGVLDRISPDRIQEAADLIVKYVRANLTEICREIESGKPLEREALQALTRTAGESLAGIVEMREDADSRVDEETDKKR